MRLPRIGWIALAAVIVCGGLLTHEYHARKAREYKLRDGSVVRLEKVYYGKPEPFDYESWSDKLKKKLPDRLSQIFTKSTKTMPGARASFVSWRTISDGTHTNEDALYIYITQRDAAGKFQNVQFTQARLLDEHGCIFQQTSAGGEHDGRLPPAAWMNRGAPSMVVWFRFEAFPRYESRFRLQLLDRIEQSNRCEFIVANPFPRSTPRKDLNPEPFPVKQTNGGVTFVLASVGLQTNAKPKNRSLFINPVRIAPAFNYIEDGQVSSNWQALDMELYDSSGNFSWDEWREMPMLCTNEPAWKMRVRFFGSEQSRGASNATWTLHGIAIPAAGEYTDLHDSQTIDGVPVDAWFFAGPGEFLYSSSRKVIERASVLKPSDKNNNESVGIGDTLRSKSPHLTFKFSPLPEDRRLTVRATDEQGRDFYGYETPSPFRMTDSNRVPHEVLYLHKTYGKVGAVISIFFDLPPDSKKIDLTFCVHTCRIADFVFKPPTTILPASANAAK